MKPRLRSPSLFWTFAGSFLAVLVAVAVLQTLVMVLVLRPITAHWNKTHAELLTSQVVGELADLPAPVSDEDIRAVLHSIQSERGAERLMYIGTDRRVISHRGLPPHVARRIEQLTESEVELPPQKPGEPPWRPGEPVTVAAADLAHARSILFGCDIRRCLVEWPRELWNSTKR